MIPIPSSWSTKRPARLYPNFNLRPFERIKPIDFANDYNLQVIGSIKVIQAVAAKLKNADNPSIVLFSTFAVQTGLPFHTQVSASKGAIEGLTKALAAEYAPKILVNAIAPSLTDTPLAASLLNSDAKREANANRHPLQRNGKVEDIASMAEFLLSSKSSWITGQIFHVDGGISSLKFDFFWTFPLIALRQSLQKKELIKSKKEIIEYWKI